MKQLMLKQDAERSFFLAAMMTTATEATLTRRTIWMKRRNQAFLVAPNNCLWMISSAQIANKASISSSVQLRPRSATFNSLRFYLTWV